MFSVQLASEHDKAINDRISEIFVDGFYQWLRFFSKDKGKLVNAFSHMFNRDVFYIALLNDEICGIAACSDGKIKAVRLEGKELTKHLGFVKGSIAYAVLKREFEEKQYPFPIEPGMGCIEFVATSPEYRGKGVASQIIRGIFETTPFTSYVLEVADTNVKAVSLYAKLGFAEFMRVEEKHSKRSGINHLIYMKYSK